MHSTPVNRPARLASVVFMLVVLGYFTLFAYRSWVDLEQHTLGDLTQLSEFTASSADDYFRHMETASALLADEIVSRDGIGHPRRGYRLLKRFQRFMPALTAINLVRPDGRILMSTGFALGAPIPDPFRRSKVLWSSFRPVLHAKGLQIGLPMYGPLAHEWVIPLRYPVRDQAGRLVAVLGLILPLRHQQVLWRQISLADQERIGLIRSDGRLESLWPVDPRWAPSQIYGLVHRGIIARVLAAHRGVSSGTFVGTTDGVTLPILGAYVRLPHYPGFAAFVALPKAVLWTRWAGTMRLPLALAVLLLLAIVLIYRWNRRRLEAWTREREQALARETGLRNFYAALSEINQLIAHHPDPDELFPRVCDIVVACTGLALAWIALVDIEGSDDGRIVAASGPARAYVEGLAISCDPDRPSGRGPFGRTMRSGDVLVVPSIDDEPDFAPWRERARAFGLTSTGSFPFQRRGRVVGVLTVYSGSPAFFQPELVQLLEELATDISFSLQDFDRQQELLQLALHDPLTGLANRQLFIERLGHTLAIARRDDRLVAVGVVDLDGFKQINDRLGHAAGDDVLRQVARRIQGSIRETDTLARLGGDEFGLVLGHAVNIQEIHAVLHRCITVIATPFVLESGETVPLTGSIGVAVYPFDDVDLNSLMRHADLALYRAKDSGGNGFAFFEQPLEDQMMDRHRARVEIQEAFRRRQFIVHYQPQVEMAHGRVLGFEALIRWQHPERGLLMPSEFIRLIEEDAHFVRGLGRFVLEEVASQIEYWRDAGLNTTASVNIGARHLLAPEFLNDVREVLARHPGVAQALTLEVTETDALRDLGLSAQVLNDCRGLGPMVSIDDFGSGYASLTYLQKLPIDQIKIDQGFVRGLLNDPKNIAIIASLISASRLLGIDMIAEGVESIEHGSLLLKLGCTAGQGYAIARAMAPEAVPDWARAWVPDPHWVQIGAHPYAAENHGLLMLLMQHEKQMRLLLARIAETFTAPATAGSGLEEFRCVIEDWYATEGLRLFGDLPQFAMLRDAYHRLCNEVQELVREGLATPSLEARMAKLRALDERLQRDFETLLAG